MSVKMTLNGRPIRPGDIERDLKKAFHSKTEEVFIEKARARLRTELSGVRRPDHSPPYTINLRVHHHPDGMPAGARGGVEPCCDSAREAVAVAMAKDVVVEDRTFRVTRISERAGWWRAWRRDPNVIGEKKWIDVGAFAHDVAHLDRDQREPQLDDLVLIREAAFNAGLLTERV